jgi:uncharacterized membrane protein YfcA
MEDDTNAVGLPLASPRLPSSATWKETWVNVGFPTFFGVAVGAGWQIAVQPRLTNEVPNPVQAALLALLLLSPFFHRWLTDHEPSRWKEYLAGASVLSTFFLLVWMTGYGALICGGYVAIVVWIWISTSWWRFHLPPFRSALWHTLGVNVGALAGSVLAFNLAG